MWRRWLTARRAVVLGCIALVAAGAGVAFAVASDEKLCTLVGGMTGVTVQLPDGDPRDAGRTTVCVEGHCRRVTRQVAGALFPLEASGPRVVSVVFVLERMGEAADVRVMSARLKRFEPNGPGCGTWWTAVVRPEQARPVGERREPRHNGPPTS
jgi:hypothetical protein